MEGSQDEHGPPPLLWSVTSPIKVGPGVMEAKMAYAGSVESGETVSTAHPTQNTIATVAPELYSKHASTAAYIRQRGRCRLCGQQTALSGGFYYDAIAPDDPHWRRTYKTVAAGRRAAAGLRMSMARMACLHCAPPEAAPRRAPLLPAHALTGPEPLVAFVRLHYRALYRGIASGAERAAWWALFKDYARTVPLSQDAFSQWVWGRLRQPHRRRRQGTPQARCTAQTESRAQCTSTRSASS